jgi:hypothetical protein
MFIAVNNLVLTVAEVDDIKLGLNDDDNNNNT